MTTMRRSSYAMLTRNKPFEALAHDSTATIGFWRPYMEDVMEVNPRYEEETTPATLTTPAVTTTTLVEKPAEYPDQQTFPISAASTTKAFGRTKVYEENITPVTSVIEQVPDPLTKEELASRRAHDRKEVKGHHAMRRTDEKSLTRALERMGRSDTRNMGLEGRHVKGLSEEEILFANSIVKHVTAFDDSKLKKMEAEMARKFNEKVSKETRGIRVTRQIEQSKAHVTELVRGNELFDKGDYLAALAEFELAAQKAEVPELAPFAHLNRGNAYKALSFRPQASAAYRQVLDATARLRSPSEKLLHACALNNLGGVCKDGGRLEQALQHFSAALALYPRSHLALKNLAEVHMVYARQLQAADAQALAPPQHEMAKNAFDRTMDIDWHLPMVFCVGEAKAQVPLRIDTRITSEREDGAPEHNPNEVYHVSLNLTHVHRAN